MLGESVNDVDHSQMDQDDDDSMSVASHSYHQQQPILNSIHFPAPVPSPTTTSHPYHHASSFNAHHLSPFQQPTSPALPPMMPPTQTQSQQSAHHPPPPAMPHIPPFQLAHHQAQQLSALRYKEQLLARHKGKQEALDFMIQRLAMNDEMWKVVDLEEYTLENPDIVITDRHIHDLACALRKNNNIVAIRLPECEGLVTWNALWPFFESLKHNKSVTRMFVSSSGKIFGHMVSVFLTNSILGFFDCNYTIRTLGSLSKAPTLKKEVRVSLNRNILHHYVPKKIALLRRLWHSKLTSDHPLKASGNDAMSLLFEFDEHFQMIKNLAKGTSSRCPQILGSDPLSTMFPLGLSLNSTDDDCDLDMEEHECSCGEYVSQATHLGKRPSIEIESSEFDQDCRPIRKRARSYGDDA
jgi:hypothetical protein